MEVAAPSVAADVPGLPPDQPYGLTVIIPAHNEEVALATTLEGLLRQKCPWIVQVIVVANGCQDGTAEVARSFSGLAVSWDKTLTVLELDEASKPAALNAGDAVAVGPITAYVDADIVLSENALVTVVEALQGKACRLAAPSIAVAWNPSRIARSYGRVWSSTPEVRRHVIGCGFYAVTAESRRRWGVFPDVISDDRYVRSLFRSDEQTVVDSAVMTIDLPTSCVELMRVRSRWCRGNRQLASAFPDQVPEGERWREVAAIWFVLRHPGLWLDAPMAACVYVLAKVRSRRIPAAGQRTWEVARSSPVRRPRDEPSRRTDKLTVMR